eukprot:jgi/Tetstr1/450038/TSEL_037085.t1
MGLFMDKLSFEVFGTELLNFLFSDFGIIFVFMALAAQLGIGLQMSQSISTLRQLPRQLMVLPTADLADFGKRTYTKVSKTWLLNKVDNSIGTDVLLVTHGLWLWPSRRWIWDMAEVLNVLPCAYPRVFENCYNQAGIYTEEVLNREECVDLRTADAVAMSNASPMSSCCGMPAGCGSRQAL